MASRKSKSSEVSRWQQRLQSDRSFRSTVFMFSSSSLELTSLQRRALVKLKCGLSCLSRFQLTISQTSCLTTYRNKPAAAWPSPSRTVITYWICWLYWLKIRFFHSLYWSKASLDVTVREVVQQDSAVRVGAWSPGYAGPFAEQILAGTAQVCWAQSQVTSLHHQIKDVGLEGAPWRPWTRAALQSLSC